MDFNQLITVLLIFMIQFIYDNSVCNYKLKQGRKYIRFLIEQKKINK